MQLALIIPITVQALQILLLLLRRANNLPMSPPIIIQTVLQTVKYLLFTIPQQVAQKPLPKLSPTLPEQICEILNICEVKPSVLQTEVHPYYQEKELKKFLSHEDIKIQAWYPLGHGDNALLNEPLFKSLAEKYGKSTAQIILRWHIQDGNIVIPGSKNSDHIKANFDIFDFSLTDEEMAEISSLDKGVRYYTSTPEMLKKYAEMIPPVDEQK